MTWNGNWGCMEGVLIISELKIFGSRCFYLDIFAENVLTSKGNLYNFNTAPAS